MNFKQTTTETTNRKEKAVKKEKKQNNRNGFKTICPECNKEHRVFWSQLGEFVVCSECISAKINAKIKEMGL